MEPVRCRAVRIIAFIYPIPYSAPFCWRSGFDAQFLGFAYDAVHLATFESNVLNRSKLELNAFFASYSTFPTSYA